MNEHGLSTLSLTEESVKSKLAGINVSVKDVFLYTVSDGGRETVILTSGENVSAHLKKGKHK